MPFNPTLVTPALIPVNPLPYKLRCSAIIGGDGGGEFPAIEDLAVHLVGCGEGVVTGDKLDESDSAAKARVAVFEYGDSGELAEGGEEGVEVGVGEGVVNVGDVDGGFGRG